MAPRLNTGDPPVTSSTAPALPGRGRARQGIPAEVCRAAAPQAELASTDVAVLAVLADGHTQDTAARRLDMSSRTLRRRLTAICAQLRVHEPIEAVVWAAKHGLL